jgi:hypothetical protein
MRYTALAPDRFRGFFATRSRCYYDRVVAGGASPWPSAAFYGEAAFDDGTVKAMTTAYEETLQHLGLERNDPLTEIIAVKLIEFSQVTGAP